MLSTLRFLVSLLLFFVGYLGLSSFAAPAPNVIIILADDMGLDSVSAFNPKLGFSTPHIDKMASEGMSFMDAHSSSAVCSPTRYGILTGRYNWRSRLKRGIVGQYQEPLIKADRLTIGKMLQERGYDTACIGKWHLGIAWQDKNGNYTRKVNQIDWTKPALRGPLDAGFHHYYGDDVPNWPPYVWINDHKTQGIPSLPKPKAIYGSPGPMLPGWTLEPVLPEITRRSAAYVREKAKSDKPFFLFFPLTSPHSPIAPDKEFIGSSGIDKYCDFVVQTDWCVGQILKAVDDAGIADNTIVFFTCDNGTSPNFAKFTELEKKGVDFRYSYRGNKADLYEGGHKVPFIVRWPGKIKAGSRSDELVCTTDFMGTVADVIDYKLPPTAAEDSFSLWPILAGKATAIPDRQGLVNHSISGNFAIRQGPWKLMFSHGSGGWSAPREADAKKKKLPPIQLYNLADDPREQTNLQAQHPERVAEMKKLLRTIVDNGRSTPGPNQPNDGAWWPQLPWPKP